MHSFQFEEMRVCVMLYTLKVSGLLENLTGPRGREMNLRH